MEVAKIGATPKGGVCRLALTDLDKAGRDLIVSWAKAAGCTVTVDTMGNVFMRRAGRVADAAPVVTEPRMRIRSRRAAASTASTACSVASR